MRMDSSSGKSTVSLGVAGPRPAEENGLRPSRSSVTLCLTGLVLECLGSDVSACARWPAPFAAHLGGLIRRLSNPAHRRSRCDSSTVLPRGDSDPDRRRLSRPAVDPEELSLIH